MTDNKSLSAELRRWRHKVRGTEYDEIGTAELQASTGDVEEGALLTVYRDGHEITGEQLAHQFNASTRQVAK